MRPLYSYFIARKETDKSNGRQRVRDRPCACVRAYVYGYLHVRACKRARLYVCTSGRGSLRVLNPSGACFFSHVIVVYGR